MAAGGGKTEETCSRLLMVVGSLPTSSSLLLFVKATWFPSHFLLSITDGLRCWTCNARGLALTRSLRCILRNLPRLPTEQAVRERALGWDETVAEYLQRAKLYLSNQIPQSTYSFIPDGENRKISWTMEKNGTKLEAKWKCEMANNEQQTTCEILDYLMDANVKLSEEVLRKTQSFERMKLEAENCLKQNEQFKNAKQQFEVEIFEKFVAVLNSKKAKLREVRDKLARLEPVSSGDQRDKRSSDFDDETDDEDEGEDDDDGQSNDSGNKKKDGVERGLEDAKADVDKDTDTKFAVGTSSCLGHVSPPDTNQPGKLDASSMVVDSAAALLADSMYTSAPKRRRRL